MKRTTMRYRELMRLVERLNIEHARLIRHSDSLLPNDRARWIKPLNSLCDAIHGVRVMVSVERPEDRP